jgi:hypothetical protein
MALTGGWDGNKDASSLHQMHLQTRVTPKYESPENIGFDFRILWSDDDMVVLIISAWNGSFGGAAKVYVNLDEMEEGADVLSGFPRTISDQREIAFGSFEPNNAGGGVRMRFYCAGSAGHAFVQATIEADRHSATTDALRSAPPQTASFLMQVEPAAIDSFVKELHRAGMKRAGSAFLAGTAVD